MVGVRRRLSTVADVAVTVAVSHTADAQAIDVRRPTRWSCGRTVQDWKIRRTAFAWMRPLLWPAADRARKPRTHALPHLHTVHAW